MRSFRYIYIGATILLLAVALLTGASLASLYSTQSASARAIAAAGAGTPAELGMWNDVGRLLARSMALVALLVVWAIAGLFSLYQSGRRLRATLLKEAEGQRRDDGVRFATDLQRSDDERRKDEARHEAELLSREELRRQEEARYRAELGQADEWQKNEQARRDADRLKAEEARQADALAHAAALRREEELGRAEVSRIAAVRLHEARRYEGDMEAAWRVVHKAERIKSQLMAGIRHELSMPLQAIVGHSEMLQEEAEDAGIESMMVDLSNIRKAGTQLLGVVGDLVDWLRIEEGGFDLDLETFEVSRLIADTEAMLRPLVEMRDNRLDVTVAANAGSMRADVLRLRQVLSQVVGSASRMAHKGKVSLFVERLSNAGGDVISFRVSDDGSGMTPAQVATLFEVPKEVMNEVVSGSGVGLLLGQRLVELMGGGMSVESQPGKGSTFTVRVPAAPCP